MKTSVKRAWVEALRSGKYEQGQSWLAQQFANGVRQYCCLGVLCDVAGAPYSVRDDGEGTTFLDYGQSDEENDKEEVLPKHLMKAFELPQRNPIVLVNDWRGKINKWEKLTLAKLNDDDFTFPQIADLIEYFIDAEPDGEGLQNVTPEFVQRSTSEVEPDRVAYLADGWAVRFNGMIEGARWQDRGPAEAHLQLLQSGARKPQPEIRND